MGAGLGGARIAQLVERPTEKPGAMLTGVRVPCASWDFFFFFFFFFLSPSQLSVQTLLPCPYSPRVKSYA